jgi:hypothetical protein
LIRLILTVVLVLMLLSFFGGYTGWVPPHIGYGGGGVGFVLVIILIVLLLR